MHYTRDENILTIKLHSGKLCNCEHKILLKHVSVTTLRETLLGPQSAILIGVLIKKAAFQHKVNCHLIDNIDRPVGAFLGNKKAMTIVNGSEKPFFI